MTHVTHISVQHVRNHTKKAIELSPETTIITGKNGAGKTSLIEALYIALQGTSFRGSDGDVLQKNQTWYRVDVKMSDDSIRTVKFDSLKQAGRKQFTVNDKISYRLNQVQKYPVVLFEPEDLRLISGSPVRRRHFIDQFISQIDPQYQLSIRKYERALKQRNNLLKKPSASRDELFVWNVALSEYGSYIISERIAFIERINNKITEAYQSISQTKDTISVHYSHTLVDNIQQKLLSELTKNTDRDKILGYTTSGPHRDDVLISFNSLSANVVASRGENRTIILALKYLEANIITSTLSLQPIIILDDVFSELDSEHQENISSGEYQVIITSTESKNDSKIKTIRL
jgi:DNA replication and repair protein RecF